jgi:WD40 repeat protein
MNYQAQPVRVAEVRLLLTVACLWAGRAAPAQQVKERAELRAGSQPVTTLAFSPDGKVLASGDAGAVVKVWDVAADR